MMEGTHPDVVYVPGTWECPHCGFVLSKNYLHATTGAVSVNREEVREVCPNDGATLERQTWRSLAEGLSKMLAECLTRESDPGRVAAPFVLTAEAITLTLARAEANLADYALHDYLNDPEEELGDGDLELIRAVEAKLRRALDQSNKEVRT